MKKLFKRIGIIVAIFVALLIVGALLAPEQSATQTGATREASEVPVSARTTQVWPFVRRPDAASFAPETKASSDLGMTAAEYERRFNTIMSATPRSYRIKVEIAKLKGGKGFTAALTDNIRVAGVLDSQSGKLSSVTLLGANDGNPRAGADIGYVAVAALGAAIPNESASTIAPEIDALIETVMAHPDETARRRVNGIVISMTHTEDAVLFEARPD